jgi:hypothetical protein
MDGSYATPASPFYPLTPSLLANSYIDAQNADFMQPADDLDNLGQPRKGLGADKLRNAPRPAPAPANDQAAISAASCDACFATGNWYSAVSEQEVEALAGAAALGQAANPAAAVAGMAVLLGTYWGVRKDDPEAVRRRFPRLTKV